MHLPPAYVLLTPKAAERLRNTDRTGITLLGLGCKKPKNRIVNHSKEAMDR